MTKKMHNANNLPGTLVTDCDKCEALLREIKDLKQKIQNIEDLAEWYYVNVNSSISAHRIRQALEGNVPNK
jgi:hypothetical protein